MLKRYLKSVPVVRPFFDVTPDSSIEEVVREAPRHPVFRLIPDERSQAPSPLEQSLG